MACRGAQDRGGEGCGAGAGNLGESGASEHTVHGHLDVHNRIPLSVARLEGGGVARGGEALATRYGHLDVRVLPRGRSEGGRRGRAAQGLTGARARANEGAAMTAESTPIGAGRMGRVG